MWLCKFLPLAAFGCEWLRQQPSNVAQVKITTFIAEAHLFPPPVTKTVTVGIVATPVVHTFSVPPSALPARPRPTLAAGNFVSVTSNSLVYPGEVVAAGIMSLSQWFGYAAAKKIVHFPEYNFEVYTPEVQWTYSTPGLNFEASQLSAVFFLVSLMFYLSYFVPRGLWQHTSRFLARVKVASLIRGGLLIGIVLMIKNYLPCSLVSILTLGSDPVTLFLGEMRHVILFFIGGRILERVTVARSKRSGSCPDRTRKSTERSCGCHKLKPFYKAVWDRMCPGLEKASLVLVAGIGFCSDQAPSMVDAILDYLSVIAGAVWKYIALPIANWFWILLRHHLGRSCYVPWGHPFEDDLVYRSAFEEAPKMSHHDVAVYMARTKQYEMDRANIVREAETKANEEAHTRIRQLVERTIDLHTTVRTVIVMANNARDLAARLANLHIINARGSDASDAEDLVKLANFQLADICGEIKVQPYTVASCLQYSDKPVKGLHCVIQHGSRPPVVDKPTKQNYCCELLNFYDENVMRQKKGLPLNPRTMPRGRIPALNIFTKDAFALNSHYMSSKTVDNFAVYTAGMHDIKATIDNEIQVRIDGLQLEDHLLGGGELLDYHTPVKKATFGKVPPVWSTPLKYVLEEEGE